MNRTVILTFEKFIALLSGMASLNLSLSSILQSRCPNSVLVTGGSHLCADQLKIHMQIVDR
jgi:hypothetical protein